VTVPLTLRDVAAHAGVSPATVSRTLNGDTRVDVHLRARVEASVETLGYRRNMLARNLRRRRLDAIGVMVSDIENPHFSEMVKIIEQDGFRAGYRVLVCGTNESRDKQRLYLQMLADERVAGVILSPTDPAGPDVGDLLDAGIPVVAFDREVSDPRADTVIADNVSGSAAATNLLIQYGHTDIAFVGGGKGVETSIERLTGYKRAMRSVGLPTKTTIGHFRIEGGRRAVAELLALETPPTAVVVANNLMTLGAIKAAHEAKVRIPGDFSLVGIDNPYWSEFVNPPITSLAQPVAEMAREAIEMLLARLDGDASPPRRSVHAFDLVVRESASAPTRARRAR
jgi:LacI family transcriptional regulator